MSQFTTLYSKYYDLFYKDKDYIGEVDYIHSLIQKFNLSTKSILDLGCGTGKHAELLANKGYNVHGVDLSNEMLEIARTRTTGREDKLKFDEADITEVDLKKKFDVVLSLFHVVSYQNTNEALNKTFQTASKHLNESGIFIFDFWYGPAVLTDRPVVRVKKLEDEQFEVTRIAEPEMHCATNIVDVNYKIFIRDKVSNNCEILTEQHKMRYLFDPELEALAKQNGFAVLCKYKWLEKSEVGFDTWNVVWVLRK